MSSITVKILHDITELGRASWNECALASDVYNPFVTYEFLHALESSGSVSRETGWQPFHLMVEDQGNLIGVVPMYLKSHSQGEYVFDYSWADAWQRAGGRYYPKLQSSIPFTPATSPRLLCKTPSPEHRELLIDACIEVAEQTKVSSLHLTFMPEDEWATAKDANLLQRMDQQFHWHNAGYHTFDDFLADLASKKRKNLKRERRDAVSAGIEIEWLSGEQLREEHWDAFYQFYLDTGHRKWGSAYLTRDFFTQIHNSMPQDILLIMAKREGRYIAGALNFIGGDTLFGRNWGCIEDHRFLHFEVCYYQAIDFAIARGLAKVEAGAQGGHKVIRGYLPAATRSAHWIADENFRDAIDRFLQEERRYVAEDMAHVEASSPFNALVDIQRIKDTTTADPEPTKTTP